MLVAALSVAASPSPHAQESAPRQAAGKSQAAAGPALNLNTATSSELQKLPGIGASTAARILEYRQKNGPFKKPEELMNVRGIGEKSFLKLKPLVTVVAPRTDAKTDAETEAQTGSGGK
ncbi:MAG: helix-hairpin-helix domain-containing protein [Acidobacteriota bacterium]|nr:helix-hairpin-helix domain-containing protein [Acidobacteriota bacterium]